MKSSSHCQFNELHFTLSLCVKGHAHMFIKTRENNLGELIELN